MAPAAVLAALLLRTLFFAVSVTRVPPSSDECIYVLTAKRVAEGKMPLLNWGQPYQFPLEAFPLALLVKWMPRNAFGARYLFFGLNLLLVVLLWRVLRRTVREESRWPGALLLLFPSAYWLTTQTAYVLSAYTALQLISAYLVWLVAAADTARRRDVASLLAGLAAGLGFCNHMLILPVALLGGAALCLGRNARDALRCAPLFVAGLLVGLIPHFLAAWRYPGAHEAVKAARPLAHVLPRLWNPALSITLPATIGPFPCLFPDFRPTLVRLPGPARAFGVLYAVLLGTALVLCTTGFLRRLRANRWPSLRPNDVFAGVSLLCLVLFAVSRRGMFNDCRYLLPAACSFPFVISMLHASAGGVLRKAVGVLAVLLTALNVLASAVLIREWGKPGFAAGVPDLPDTRPVIEYLDRLGADRCYASLWLSYRITHDTDERIICSQPFNERFPGWPLPYQHVVDQARNAPVILSDTHQARLRTASFKRDLARADIAARQAKLGPLTVFHGFASQTADSGPPLPAPTLRATASHNPGDAYLLVDGDPRKRWKSAAMQTTNMWIDVHLDRRRAVSALALLYGDYSHDQAASLTVLVGNGGGWRAATGPVPAAFDGLRLIGGRLTFGESTQTIRFPATTAGVLRLRTESAHPDRCWSVGEIQVYESRP
jgi:hypothetical protein